MSDTVHLLAERALSIHGPANAARIYREAEAEHWAEAQWCGSAAARRKEQLSEGYGRIADIIEQLTGEA